MKEITVPEFKSEKSVGEWLEEKFTDSIWPCSGGWGYGEKDIVSIQADTEGEGIDLEGNFIYARCVAELSERGVDGQKFENITIYKGMQRLVYINGKPADVIDYTVTAIPAEENEKLQKEYEENDCFRNNPAGAEKFNKKAEAVAVTYATKCYFDISGFFGKY